MRRLEKSVDWFVIKENAESIFLKALIFKYISNRINECISICSSAPCFEFIMQSAIPYAKK